MPKHRIDYVYRGQIERPSRRGYVWHDGYSSTADDGAVRFPWMTKAECRQDAKSQGASARFVRIDGGAS